MSQLKDMTLDSLKINVKRVPLGDYSLLTPLNELAHGMTRACLRKDLCSLSSVKVMGKQSVLKACQEEHVRNEALVLSAVEHPFISRFQGFAQCDRYVYLFSQLVQGGDLFSLLRRQVRLSINDTQLYSAQVVLALEYLHSLGVVYRDLKPENLYIGADGYLQLNDFSFAKVVKGRTYTLCGTPEYLAPEVLTNKGHGKAVDWWGLGVFIYELLVGIDPFHEDEPMKIYERILQGKYRCPCSMDRRAKSLIKHLLQIDLSRRYGNLRRGAQQIKQHRFYAQMQWQQLLDKNIIIEQTPSLKGPNDLSYFEIVQPPKREHPPLKASEDPFMYW